MGLFGTKESASEIDVRIRNSECGQLFANAFCNFFRTGDEHFQWLMGNSKERVFQIEAFKNGVSLKQLEVSQQRLKATGSYEIGSEGWSFGSSGYEDLPNQKYVTAFRQYLLEQIERNCPGVVVTGNYIKLADNVKKGW